VAWWRERLRHSGVERNHRVTAVTLVDTLVARLGSDGAAIVARAPGRVNLIGEHTDYNDGFVLPVPIDRFVEAAVRPRSGRRVRMFAADPNQVVEFELGDGPGAAWPSWTRYLYGLAEELRTRGMLARGFDVAVRGNIPQGAGLGSSAALEVATVLALEKCFLFDMEPLESIRLCRDVEHRWAGVKCGVMDQMASRLGRSGHALLIDCRDLQFREVPLQLGDHRLVVVDSGVQRRLKDSAYNRRREECEQGVTLLRRLDPGIRSLRDVDSDQLAAGRDLLPGPVAARCQHVIEENGRVLEAEMRLGQGDLAGFGELMVASHESLRDLFDVSHPALDRLVETANGVDGVLGSRLCGAGFGGCTLTLAASPALAELRQKLGEAFDDLGLNGSMLVIGPADESGVVKGTP
jgi:galactokinase